ncbi:MAG: ferrous iron transport protein A [Ruminococcaceae bacterium]|nr:ferrous iron transport protein A [Oscillospiraceae bacterium]
MVLYALPEGEAARIRCLAAEADVRHRLGDLGFIPGTHITCLGRSPLGDPTAYLVRGAVIALRNEDAEKVFVERDG